MMLNIIRKNFRGSVLRLAELRWIDANRQRRIFELLTIMWFLGAVDLVLTLWANHYTLFYEWNPVARSLLEHGMDGATVAYKIAMLAGGTAVFWRSRRHRSSEMAVWLLCLAYVGLMFQWSAFTAHADELSNIKQMADFAQTPIVTNLDALVARAEQRDAHRVHARALAAEPTLIAMVTAHATGQRFTPATP